MTKQIKWALDVLNSGAWWDNIPDDVSDADMNPLYDAIYTVNDVLERLTYCSECKYFKQKTAKRIFVPTAMQRRMRNEKSRG